VFPQSNSTSGIVLGVTSFTPELPETLKRLKKKTLFHGVFAKRKKYAK
jgi:ribosomal protein S21